MTDQQSDTEEKLEIAEKVLRPAIEYPSAYDECREAWAGFITDPGGESDYVTAITEHVRTVAKYDVPMDDRSDVIIAGFWAASAESVINQRGKDAHESEHSIRVALENVWQEVSDGQ